MIDKLRSAISRFVSDRSAVESAKTALIVLLAVSACLLAGEAGLFGLVNNGAAGADTGGAELTSTQAAAAAEPFVVAVTPENGSHMGVMWDEEELASVYSRFSAALGEALGSSGAPVQVEEEEWRSALSGAGVYFDFLNDQQLSVLAGWLGTGLTQGAGSHTARRICLARDGDGVALYYIRERKNEYCRCDTALSWTAVQDAMSGCLPNGAAFVFELREEYDGVDDYFLTLAAQPSLQAVSAGNPLSAQEDSAALMAAFGMSDYLVSEYPEADGAVVYVQDAMRLRLGADGVVSFTGEAEDGGSAAAAPAKVIEKCRALAQSTVGVSCGAASLTLTYIYYDSSADEYTVRFDYRLSGLPVTLASGEHAAEFTVSGDVVTGATLVYRRYTLMGVGVSPQPMPALQQVALTQAAGGGEPVLCWFDDMTAASPRWMIW